jgi:hypothetical protein
LIAVLVQIAQIGAGIVGMNIFTRRNIRQRMTDGQTVLHHVLPFRNGDQGKLMSTSIAWRNVTDWLSTVTRRLRQIRQRDGHVIQRMDFDVLHINLKRP